MSNGAKADIKNNDEKTPGQVATDSNVKKILGTIEENGNADNLNNQKNAFVPNYLQYPNEFRIPTEVSAPKSLDTSQEEMMSLENISTNSVILKIRVAQSTDPDFIEIDLHESQKTLEGLKSQMCQELEINNPEKVERVRKLPNTRLRRDIEIRRLEDYAELELVMANK